VPYAKPIQLYLVVAVVFYLIVSMVSDYTPSAGDHHYFGLSTYRVFKWAEPFDNAVVNSIDSMWEHKGRKIEQGILKNIDLYKEKDGSLTIMGVDNSDSLLIPADKIPVYAFNKMRSLQFNMFHEKVSMFGKTLLFILLPLFAAFFFIIFFKKLKYYGAALILATHFMIYNLCFYAFDALVSGWPKNFESTKAAAGWLTLSFRLVFYNESIAPFSTFIFGGSFEFKHLLFWMPWFFVAFKRLFDTPWWKNLLISYFFSRVFYFLIFGVLKKILIAFTIWTMH
jgi:hypothetical protein